MEDNNKELSLEEMQTIAGGEEGTGECQHKHVSRHVKYDITDGKNDWGYHVSRYYLFRCKDCGQEWKSTDPNFKKWQK